MPRLFAVLESKARDAHQPAPSFRAEHKIVIQPVSEEGERPAALFLEGCGKGRGVPLQAFQADRPKRVPIGAGERAHLKSGWIRHHKSICRGKPRAGKPQFKPTGAPSQALARFLQQTMPRFSGVDSCI
jgi:hypothetical protein